MRLSDYLSREINNSIADDQGRWRQYVLDHLDYITARSPKYDVADEVMNLFEYDLGRFLKDHMSRSSDLAWIVRLLNNLPNDLSFYKSGIYIIPSDELLNQLYSSYRTINKNNF